MSIRIRLIIIFLSVVIIPIFFVGAISYLSARKALEQTTLAGLHAISEFMEGKVFLYLDKLKTRTMDFSSDGYIRDSVVVITSQDLKERVEKLNTHLIKNKKPLDENIVRIDILDVNGEIIASTDSGKIGASRHNERYFMKGKEEIYVADIRKDNEGTVLEISAPLKDRIDPKKTIGVIVNCYSAILDEMFTGKAVVKMGAITQMTSFGKTGETYLVNQESLMVTSSLFIKGAVLNQKVDTYPVRKGFEDNQEVKGTWLDYRGIPVIGSSMLINIGDFKWVLLSEQDVAEALIPVYNLRKLLIIFGLIVALIVVPVALSVSQSISKPIHALHRGAGIIAGGDLSCRVGTNEKDEIGQLSREFDKMAGALEKRIREIVRIGDELKTSNQQLQASEQQMKASNQQLRASEQQLHVEITERRKAEQALENLNKQLQATVEKLTLANRELQHFAHIAAHDLKAPLRAIGTLADWISTDYADKFDEEGKREVELLVGRVARMSDMIDSILRYSEAGRVIKEKEKVNLNVLIEEVMAGIAPPENISVTVENELPVLEGEKTHFMQVFQNLLSNAVKYMDKPRGQIKVGCTEENGFWKFSVADNGPGVEKEYFEKIFEMFQTLLPRDEFETTGIGLSIVKKIVETYGGRVWIESEVGKGSVFFFTLPNQEMKVADDAKLKANIVS